MICEICGKEGARVAVRRGIEFPSLCRECVGEDVENMTAAFLFVIFKRLKLLENKVNEALAKAEGKEQT